MNNIGKVVKNKLCTNCGTCVSACPFEAISYIQKQNNFEIKVDKSRCKKCGLCLKICPGREVDFKGLNKELFGMDKKVKHDPALGYFKKCYLAYSKNKDLRFKCSSGGVITAILIYLLKNKIIDGALVTTMDNKNPLISKPFIAHTEKEIIEARGSKYTPVILNQCLRKIINSRKKKFAVVGLPCHLHGIRKFQKINPILKKKIKISLGIMCGQGVNLSGTNFILKQLGLNSSDVKRFQYRGEGWPGYMSVNTKTGQTLKTPYRETFKIFTTGFFTPERCFLCPDLTNELADISFGDAWVPRLIKKGDPGTNFVITRTQRGQKLLDQMSEEIFCKSINPRLIIESKKIRIFCKKDSHKLVTRLAKILGIGVPQYTRSPNSKIGPTSSFVLIFYLNSILSNKYPRLFLAIPLFVWNFPLTAYKKILNIYKKAKIKL